MLDAVVHKFIGISGEMHVSRSQSAIGWHGRFYGCAMPGTNEGNDLCIEMRDIDPDRYAQKGK
jgi:hypothetical protein